MRWPAKIGIGVGVVVVLLVLAYIVLFPVHNWRLKHRISVAFGVRASALQVVDSPEAAAVGGTPFSVPALQAAAERLFPMGTPASDVSKALVRVFGSDSVHVYERAPGDRRLYCGFDSEQGWWYRDTMWVEFALDSSNRVVRVIKAGYWGITL
jgi:hypothetical protein